MIQILSSTYYELKTCVPSAVSIENLQQFLNTFLVLVKLELEVRREDIVY